MCERQVNTDNIFSEVDNNFEKVKSSLKFIRDFEGDPQENLTRLSDRNDELHTNGMGPFIISQFVAGAHPKEYTTLLSRIEWLIR
jgi:hypothetical protein